MLADEETRLMEALNQLQQEKAKAKEEEQKWRESLLRQREIFACVSRDLNRLKQRKARAEEALSTARSRVQQATSRHEAEVASNRSLAAKLAAVDEAIERGREEGYRARERRAAERRDLLQEMKSFVRGEEQAEEEIRVSREEIERRGFAVVDEELRKLKEEMEKDEPQTNAGDAEFGPTDAKNAAEALECGAAVAVAASELSKTLKEEEKKREAAMEELKELRKKRRGVGMEN